MNTNSTLPPPPVTPPAAPPPAPSAAAEFVRAIPDLVALLAFVTLAVTRTISGELAAGLITSIFTGRLFPRPPPNAPPSSGGPGSGTLAALGATGVAVLLFPILALVRAARARLTLNPAGDAPALTRKTVP